MIYNNLKILGENDTNDYGILIERDGFVGPDIQPKLMNEMKNESKDDNRLIVYATLQKADTPNRNGRVYPFKVLKRENERYQKVIQHNTSFHQLDHPDDSVVELKGGSPYRVLETWWEGKYLFGKLEIIVSPGYRNYGIVSTHGDLVALYLLEYNMTLGVSSRGVGSLEQENGYNMVQEDFELICWDAVSSPSTPGSYIYQNKEEWKEYDQEPEDLDDIHTNSDEAMQDNDDFMKKLQQTFFSN